MPKSVEDIIVPERRKSIRDIPIPEGRRRPAHIPPPPPPVREHDPEDHIRNAREVFSSTPPSIPRRKKSKKGMWFAILIVVAALAFAALSYFNSSTFTYVPRSQSISFVSNEFSAKKTGEGALLFSTVKLSLERSLDVPASGEEEVSHKASGTIVVYNDATTEPQRLVATTRFETPEGLVYRAPTDFTIPGKKTVDGVSQPGSIEIVVHADQGGEKYNMGMADFTLPGLKGTARYSTIYARSKTPMSGGFVGTEKVVSEADTLQAKSNLENTLKADLIAEATLEVPEGFVLVPALSQISFETLPQTTSANEGQTKVNMKGNLSGIIFKKTDLSFNLSTGKVQVSGSDTVDLLDLNELTFAYQGGAPSDLASQEEIKFTVTGNTKVVWLTDEVALRADLAGRSKKEISGILNNYPTIVSATSVIRPIWKSSFPKSPSRISVRQLPVE